MSKSGKSTALLVTAFLMGGFLLPNIASAYVTVSDHITTNTTWNSGEIYVVTATININSGVQLTVEPGAIVKFQYTWAGLNVNGELSSNATTASKSYFTSYKDDTVGGDTNGDSSSTSPAKGNWGSIQVNSGASVSFDNTIIRYGGASSTPLIIGNGGSIDISESELSSGSWDAVSADAGTVSVANSVIEDIDRYGVYANGYSNADLTITNNTFIDNASYPVYLDLNGGLDLISSGNTATGSTGTQGLRIYGTLNDNQTWNEGMPYVVTGLTIPSGKTLTVNPGTIVKFQSQASMTVSGKLDAIGDANDNIYFTSIRDDTIGGDTSPEDATNPDAGNWTSIQINSNAGASLSYASVKYGGYSSMANVYGNGGSMEIRNSVIASSSYAGLFTAGGVNTVASSSITDNYYGVYKYDGMLTVKDNRIYSNSGYGVYNYTASVIDATNNYWGTSSGPYHSSLNPGGTGNAVTNYVSIGPWFDQWPITEGGPISGVISTDQTWSSNVPYVIGAGGLTVNAGVVLNLEPPTILKFDAGASLIINGSLDAVGTINIPIYFTSIEDDSVGGDTNGDGYSEGEAGDWNRIRVNNGATANFDYASVRFGGGGASNRANIYINGGDVDMTHSILASSSYSQFLIDDGFADISKSTLRDHDNGIYVTGYGDADITDSAIYGSSLSWGIYNDSGSDVNAFYNYWNADDFVNALTTGAGPYHSSSPDRDGSAISDDVDIHDFFAGDLYREDWNCFNPVKWYCLFYGYDSVDHSNNQLRWVASGSFDPFGVDYESDWNFATTSWAGLGGDVDIIASGYNPKIQVKVVDESASAWSGILDTSKNPDLLGINHYHMKDHSQSKRRNVVTHELGHALGLGHSFTGNIMNYLTTTQTTFGAQDIIDFDYKW